MRDPDRASSTGRPEASTVLPPTPHSASEARAYVRGLLREWGVEDPEEVSVLLTSEVVSNAVLHAATELDLGVRVVQHAEGSRVRVEVRDQVAVVPAVRPVDSDGLSGRGLLLVDILSARWGTEPDGRGKVVWFEVDVELAHRDGGPGLRRLG